MKLKCEFCENPGAYGYITRLDRLVAVACVSHREDYYEPIEIPDETVSVAAVVTWLRDRAARLDAERPEEAREATAIEAAAHDLEQRKWA